MGIDIKTYAKSKKYTDESMAGAGAVRGVPCQIQSIEDITGGHKVTFLWVDNAGTSHTTPMNVMDGNDGDDGVGISSVAINSNNHLIVTYTDGTSDDAGEIPMIEVDDALSASSENAVQNKVITGALDSKVDKVDGKGLSTNDYTTAEKTKLSGIDAGAEVNAISSIKVNGTEVTPVNKEIDLNVLTNAVSNLLYYYKKTETYSKLEVDELIAAIASLSMEIVETLPATGSTTVIYLVPTGTNNVYSQYIYADGEWNLIGSTEVDLSNYYTKAQANTLLDGKQDTLTFDSTPTSASDNPVTSNGLDNAFNAKQDALTFDNVPTENSANPVKSGGVYSALAGKQDTLTFDNTPTANSDNPVKSGGVKTALDAKQDTLSFDTVPTEDSDNPVESGGVYSAEQDIYKVIGQNGAKNLIPYPYPRMSTTVRGITWADNGDGGILANGTGTSETYQPYCELNGNQTANAKDVLLKAGVWYTMTCESTSEYSIGMNVYFLDTETMAQTVTKYDVIRDDNDMVTETTRNHVYQRLNGVTNKKVSFKLYEDRYAQIQVRYLEGTDVTVTDELQYPMLRYMDDTDDTYHVYAMTNRQLTEKVANTYQFVEDTVLQTTAGTWLTSMTDVVNLLTDYQQTLASNEFFRIQTVNCGGVQMIQQLPLDIGASTNLASANLVFASVAIHDGDVQINGLRNNVTDGLHRYTLDNNTLAWAHTLLNTTATITIAIRVYKYRKV